MIDDDNVDRRLPGFQFESELLGHGREQRRGRVRGIAGRWTLPPNGELSGVPVFWAAVCATEGCFGSGEQGNILPLLAVCRDNMTLQPGVPWSTEE
jgi:hypothetical protein